MNAQTDSSRLNEAIKGMTLVEFVDQAKLVLDDGIDVKYCTEKALKAIYENSETREYSVILNTPRINKACVKEQRMESMFALTGISLGSRDNLYKKIKFDATRAIGQKVLILRTDQPKVVEASVWGHGPGDRGAKVPIPFWADCQYSALKTEFTFSSGEAGQGVQLEYLNESTPISREKLLELLAQRTVTSDVLDNAFWYEPVVLRGKIGTFSALTKWINTGLKIEDRDKQGNPITLPNGEIKMKDERKRSDEGFPVIQGRINNPEEEIYTFAVTIGTMDRAVDTNNVVKVKFLNKKLGNHLIELNSHQRIFRDAFTKGVGTMNDAFEHLTNTYRGTEVIVVGVLTRFDDKGDTIWIDIEGTMLIAPEIAGTQIAPATESPLLTTTPSPSSEPALAVPSVPATPTPAVPTAPVVPEIVAETTEVPTVTEVPTAPALVPAVVAEPIPKSAPTPVAAPAHVAFPPPMATEKEQPLAVRLDAAILESMEMYGKDKMTFEEFEEFGLCPKELIGAGNKVKPDRAEMVKKRIAKKREDLGTSEVGSYGDVDAPTSVSTLTPEEKEASTVQQVCAACDGPMEPTPHGHWEVCPENPKNKEKAQAE